MDRNLKLTIAYDGTAYHGFQRQANALTVQEVLEERLAKLFGHTIRIAGAARTDTGVHAYGQTVSFRTIGRIPTERIPIASQGILPPEIVVRSAQVVPADFHARFSAKGKTYIYRILAAERPDPFLHDFVWYHPEPLDVPAMDRAMRHILGTHDFSAFRAAGGPPVSPVRTLSAAVCRQTAEIIEFSFTGNGFLYHMVRNLVGTLVKVGTHRISPEGFAEILAGRDRSKAGITAPPQGLFLMEIYY